MRDEPTEMCFRNARRVIDNLVGDFFFAFLNIEKHFDMETLFRVY